MWSTLLFLSRFKPVTPLVLRVAAGFGFFYLHGLGKLQPTGEWDWGKSFAASGDAPEMLLYVAAWGEFLGGFTLIFGFLTRWAALGLLGIMGYALFGIHAGDPIARRELAIVYSALLIGVLTLGPGQFSLDRQFFGKKAVPE